MEKPRYRVSVSTDIDFDSAIKGEPSRQCLSYGHVMDHESGEMETGKCWRTGKPVERPRYRYGKTVWISKGYVSYDAARRSAERQLKKFNK